MKLGHLPLETNARASRQESWRAFCAIDLSVGVRASLVRQINRLREAVPGAQASWSREENIHLTLKFLGEIQTSRLNNLSNAAARAVADFSRFQITLEETGVFPKHGSPRVLWIGIKDESGKLAEFHTRLEKACAREGFAREERPFHPHLTIARLRKPQGARTLAAAHKEMRFEPAVVAVSDLLVIRSELSGAGSRYTVISRHPLEA
ncbi:MAG: RNA 2',3'-cyclic phosphodiesterase [Pyrinomonadaceae bacterium]|jgi:2'-5' RNA ligase|nr:RNA 2',3'-cyclic phosphodiesterase [Pyrinomonadaceae bacterium]